ncbi:methyltransferase domain-containing protein [Candidatus Poribacteria bacterium]|nr:methyltransferase domain-containing protein [Candidatus Poribacteria bacterium]
MENPDYKNVYRYQVFFRTKKGGCGIEYETAKAEFLSVFGENDTEFIWEYPGRMRMDIKIKYPPEIVRKKAEKLGYTMGITRVYEEPYRGAALYSYRTGRWALGWIRKGDNKILLTEVYRQDEDKILENAPDRRTFLLEQDGSVSEVKGHRKRRGVSPNDAKFILNIARLQGKEVILDPFAGLGGLVIECVERGFKVHATEIDKSLRPGLADFSDNQLAIADARKLPFRDKTFDSIITEPPFDIKYRQDVLDSISELQRVVKSPGKIVLFIAADMHDQILEKMKYANFQLDADFKIRRHSKLMSHVLVWSI